MLRNELKIKHIILQYKIRIKENSFNQEIFTIIPDLESVYDTVQRIYESNQTLQDKESRDLEKIIELLEFLIETSEKKD